MRRLLLAVLVLAALALPAVGQEPADTFGESIDVRVVNVEAVVTDRSGRRVGGLSAGDFRLLVDGREVPIEFFSEIVEGEAVSPPAEEESAETPAPAPVTARQGRSVLVFIDESFSVITHRNQVLRHMVEDLALLGPEDEMAVVAFDGLRIDRLSGWSGDTAALAEVFKAAAERPSWGIRIVAARRSEAGSRELQAEAASQDGDDAFSPGEIGSVSEIRDQARRMLAPSPAIYSRYVQVPEAASAALRAFAGEARGRKVLLYLSGGPSSPALARDANQLGFTIYPVDVQGIDTTVISNDAASAGPGPLLFDPTERLTEERLEALALATGGKVSLNGNRERALERAVEDTRAYYWLGFTPYWRGDNRSHSIRLEMRRRELTARSRKSFLDLSPMRETARRTEEILMLGGKAQSRLLRVELGTPEPAGARQVRIPVYLDVPFEALTPLPQAEGFAARAILSSGAVDKDGGRSGLTQVPLYLALPQAPAPGSFAKLTTTVTVRRAEQRLVFTLRDPVTDTVLWGETEFRP
ncbi:MAG TPA: VWA domain-containing protein [Thermoanaerobaculia bacterium]|nr:VWA domain-containing protein [Thermoanaerobaculia bacterium]